MNRKEKENNKKVTAPPESIIGLEEIEGRKSFLLITYKLWIVTRGFLFPSNIIGS